eukprot:CAMPEP_0116100038 /NCGR_PEP_ID=MMETSP0327-20121206/12084_1 /TAXON_ID=44447 /ORGANISM="Pseudo-nitzschia delicatissima, Strain B596" /LENGTH=327 /DNA_ID=CAMNT_0003591947 /DNA_START=62 /DNA_END=1045 /DNA_ORIENTATION=+
MAVAQEVTVDATLMVVAIPVELEAQATPIATPVTADAVRPPPENARVIAPATLPEGATFQAELEGVQFTARVPRGGVRQGDAFETMYPRMISVRAPATLEAGARFEAEVDGIRFLVTVPPDGCLEGYLFDCLHPSVAPQKNTATYVSRNPQWRTGLCDICDCSTGGCLCLLFMAAFCGTCLNAQIMQRMNLDCNGCARARPSGNCKCRLNICKCLGLTTIFFVALPIFMWFFEVWSMTFASTVAACFWVIFLFITMVCSRKSMREHYMLPGAFCNQGNCMDDFCVTCWFSPCSLIQMAKHTHDPKLYPYKLYSTTGLDRNAPPCGVV